MDATVPVMDYPEGDMKLTLAWVEEQTQEKRRVSCLDRFRHLFTENQGRRFSTAQLRELSGIVRWHQRISELRTDYGYTILHAKSGATDWYVMPDDTREEMAASRAPLQDIRAQLLRRSNKCAFCGAEEGGRSARTTKRVKLQPDHIVPHAHGGAEMHDVSNYQLLCQPCNLFKKEHHCPPNEMVFTCLAVADQATRRRVYDMLAEEFGAVSLSSSPSATDVAGGGRNH